LKLSVEPKKPFFGGLEWRDKKVEKYLGIFIGNFQTKFFDQNFDFFGQIFYRLLDYFFCRQNLKIGF